MSSLVRVVRCLTTHQIPSSVCRNMSSVPLSFSSTGDPSQLVTKLGPHRVSTMIVTGKPNRPFPPQFKLDLDNVFLTGAREAVSVVTNGLASGDLNVLEGLVSPDCLTGLVNNTSNLENNELVAIQPEDIFFMFISNVESTDQGNNINLVTFSLPKTGEIKAMREANKQRFEKMQESMVGQDKETIMKALNETRKIINENDPYYLFKANEIMIGNFRFVRSSPTSDWTITEVGMMSSLVAWPTIFRLRWKGRLGISLRGGYSFYNVLRYDYMTDWIAILFLWTSFVLAQAQSTGVI